MNFAKTSLKNTVSSLTLLFMHLIQVTEVMNAITMHTSCSPPEVLMSMVTFQQKNIETSVVTMAQETVSHWRKLFAELCNHHLEQNGFDERVDHRSYEDQESDLETQLEGPQATYLRRRGIFTEISLKNDEIKNRNEIRQIIKGLDQEI